MNQPVVQPDSKRALDSLFDSAPHALIISGPVGVGLATIATWYTKSGQTIWLRPQNSKQEVDYSKGAIRVEQVRYLYDQTRSKRDNKLFIIIDEADTMSHSAQAAFLKLLEEPADKVHFILLTHAPQRLADTVHSRTQHIQLRQIDEAMSRTLLDNLGVTDKKIRDQLLFIAVGLPAELTRLVADQTYFQTEATLTKDARDLLTATAYKKLIIVQRYQANREQTLRLLSRALSLARRTMSNNPQPELVKQIDRLLVARQNIASNQSVRLQLAAFVL